MKIPIAVIAYWTLVFGGAILLAKDHLERPIEQRTFNDTVFSIAAYTLVTMIGYSFIFDKSERPTLNFNKKGTPETDKKTDATVVA